MRILGFFIAYVLGVFILLLINPSAALVGALPFFIPFALEGRLIAFLFVPIVVAGGVIFWLVRHDLSKGAALHWSWPIPATVVFIGVFFVTAEVCSSVLMRAQAFNAGADCLHLHAFLRSVRELNGRNVEHGLYMKNGQLYLWSYKQLRFIPGSYATSECR